LIVVCPFVLFLLAIVLSVLLRYTDSDCPFGIFRLFLLTYSSRCELLKDRLEAKGVIRSRKSIQCNGQKKRDNRTNNELQSAAQKTKDRVTRTPQDTMVNWCAPDWETVLLHWCKFYLTRTPRTREKGQQEKQLSTIHCTLKIEQHEPHKRRGWTDVLLTGKHFPFHWCNICLTWTPQTRGTHAIYFRAICLFISCHTTRVRVVPLSRETRSYFLSRWFPRGSRKKTSTF